MTNQRGLLMIYLFGLVGTFACGFVAGAALMALVLR